MYNNTLYQEDACSRTKYGRERGLDGFSSPGDLVEEAWRWRLTLLSSSMIDEVSFYQSLCKDAYFSHGRKKPTSEIVIAFWAWLVQIILNINIAIYTQIYSIFRIYRSNTCASIRLEILPHQLNRDRELPRYATGHLLEVSQILTWLHFLSISYIHHDID